MIQTSEARSRLVSQIFAYSWQWWGLRRAGAAQRQRELTSNAALVWFCLLLLGHFGSQILTETSQHCSKKHSKNVIICYLCGQIKSFLLLASASIENSLSWHTYGLPAQNNPYSIHDDRCCLTLCKTILKKLFKVVWQNIWTWNINVFPPDDSQRRENFQTTLSRDTQPSNIQPAPSTTLSLHLHPWHHEKF